MYPWSRGKQSTIAHFRVVLCLLLKARPGAQPFIWKWILSAFESNSFSYESLCTKPRLTLKEIQNNSEMAVPFYFQSVIKWHIFWVTTKLYRAKPGQTQIVFNGQFKIALTFIHQTLDRQKNSWKVYYSKDEFLLSLLPFWPDNRDKQQWTNQNSNQHLAQKNGCN